ncbi:MAG: FAD-dependent thymidylate synthase [Acidimicrobiales bacterium]
MSDNTTTAKVVCDSVNPDGERLTTVEARFARFVLAELNTHRSFSRSSASSRAIPARKQIHRVVDDPFMPVVWASERPGMQGGPELTGWRKAAARASWRAASLGAAGMARAMVGIGVHKSIANRLIEPFSWHTVIITATEWDGFFDQRCSPLAQPEIRLLAEAIRDAIAASTPTPVARGWHLPYITPEDHRDADLLAPVYGLPALELLKAASVGRCARVSYLTHDGRRDLEADIALYWRLVGARPPHASPLEHVATPCNHGPYTPTPWHRGNFRGWDQLRHVALAEHDPHDDQPEEEEI